MLRRVFAGVLSVLCVLLITSRALAQVDQAVYSDSLQNGWQSWSWASVNLSATAPVRTDNKSIAVTADAYEAFYARHEAQHSSGLANLVFHIHGGSTGGQRMNVTGLLAGGQQASVAIGPLPANTWQQVSIPLSSLGVANKPDFVGFWIQDSTGTTQPTYYLDDITLTAAPPPSSVSVSVNAGSVIRTVDARQFGINTAIWDGSFQSATTSGLLTELGHPALRFPGGSISDEYHWATNTSLNNTWQWATSFDKFASIAKPTGAPVFVTVNYGTGTPTEAADWVKYSNVTKGYGFKYWEVGNENYGGWETDAQPRPHDPYTYAQRFKQYRDAMKAVDPTIKVGAVVVAGEDSYANYTDHPATNPRTGQTHNGWTPVMLATLKGLGVTPDFIIFHHYAQNPGGESDSFLLNSSTVWPSLAQGLRQQLTDYLGSAGASVEMVCTEYNSVSSGPGKQTTSLVNGLFYADATGQALKTEFNALMWWDLRNGQDPNYNLSPSLYGWRMYGDYGVVNGDQPADPADRYPTFYTFKLLKHFARAGDRIVAASSNYIGLGAYAAKKSNGAVNLMLINKHPTSNLTANIAISGLTPASTATVYRYGKPQDEAARTGSGSADIAQSSISNAGTSFSYVAPSYSVAVIQLVPATTTGAPAAPSNLTVKTVSSSRLDLAWQDNSSVEAGFKIERSPTGASGWTQIATVGPNVKTYSNTGLSASTKYYYRVRAHNAAGVNSAYSNTASGTTAATSSGTPAAPSGLTAAALSSTTIKLTWLDNSGNESGFKIERSSNGGSTWSQVGTVGANVSSYNAGSLWGGTTYHFRVRAYNGSGDSGYSNTASALTKPVTPSTPTIQALAGKQIKLAWGNVGGETGYRVERSLDGSSWSQRATTGVNVTTFTDSGLTAGVRYYYRVRAYNGSGSGNATSAVSAVAIN